MGWVRTMARSSLQMVAMWLVQPNSGQVTGWMDYGDPGRTGADLLTDCQVGCLPLLEHCACIIHLTENIPNREAQRRPLDVDVRSGREDALGD